MGAAACSPRSSPAARYRVILWLRVGRLAKQRGPFLEKVGAGGVLSVLDSGPPGVFFVDEHFVAYTGSRPVAKGWNTRRRHAEPGRHESVPSFDRRFTMATLVVFPGPAARQRRLDPMLPALRGGWH